MSAPSDPVILTTCNSEIAGAICLEILREAGIECQMTGGHTAGFRAEAPGWVRILVKREDVDRARLELDDARSRSVDIDWDAIDLGEPED